MAVRLRTTEGEIKEYQTIEGIGRTSGDFYYIEKFETPCGLEWKNKPKPQELDLIRLTTRLRV
jgi:hypothetical protein